MDICRICLRVDKELKQFDNRLLEFLDQLCEYATYSLDSLYCLECEHLLRKTYNFKQKCMRASDIFDKWQKSKQINKPVHDLHTFLPTKLSPWILNEHTTCISYEHNEENNDNQHTDRSELMNEVQQIENKFNIIKLEIGCQTDVKDLIKTEDVITNNAERTNNQTNGLYEDNDIEMVEFVSNEDSIKRENDILSGETKYLKTLNPYDSKHTENEVLTTNEKDSNEINISPTEFLFLNEKDFDSDDSEAPLSKTISVRRVKENVKKKSVSKKVKRSVSKNCEKLTKKKRVKLEPLQFSKERLKTELEAKFELWGELKTEDGTVIDKELILNCLNDKITDERMKQLWDSIQCDKPNPVTIRTFKHLMRNYTNEELYSSVFDIEYLNTEEKMLEELDRRKQYECYLTAKLKCQTCHLVFYKPKHLENHTRMHQETAGDFVCNICGLRFTSRKNLRGHVSSHSVAYKCKLCPLVTYYRDSMINHYNQHDGKSYTCESCGKISKSLSAYKRHQYLSHRRGRHVCTTCGRAFVSQLGVSLHKKRMHQNEVPATESSAVVNCTECDLSFPSEEVFLKHKKTWHQEHKAVKKTKRARPKNPKPPSITCRVCNAAGSIGWLTLHFRTEHPALDMNNVYADKRKHLCHICAKGFWNATSLRYHLNSHTGVRPYACDLCPKKYHSGVALNEHRLRHFPPAKECPTCGKKFKTQSNLTNHILFHTGTRRHKCSICGKAFLHSTSLNEHIRGVHYNVRRVKRGGARGVTGDAPASAGEMSE